MPKRNLVGDCKARLYYLGMVLRFATREYYQFTCASVGISVTVQLLNQYVFSKLYLASFL